MSAARSSVISPCAKRAPMDCTVPASSASRAGRVTPPGTRTHGRSRIPASAIIIAGRPLSHVATPSTPRRVGSERMSRRKTWAASFRYGRLSIIPTVPWVRPSQGSVTKPANGRHSRPRSSLGGRLHQQPDLPVARVVAQGDRPAVRRADAALRREDQELGTPELARVPPHTRVLRPAEQIAARPVEEHLRASAGGCPPVPRPPSGRRGALRLPSGSPTISSNPIAARFIFRALIDRLRSRGSSARALGKPPRRPGQCTRSPSRPAGP